MVKRVVNVGSQNVQPAHWWNLQQHVPLYPNVHQENATHPDGVGIGATFASVPGSHGDDVDCLLDFA